MSAESLPETTPAALVLVGPPAVETRPVHASKLSRALVERDPSSGQEVPGAASTPPDSAIAFAIARAMGVVVVTAHGRLDAANGAVLKSVLADLIEGQGNMKIIVDLHDVAVVDPSSMAVLVASASAARRGGDFALADPCEVVAAGLEASGLSPAVTVTRRRRLRSLSTEPRHLDEAEAWRISMAQHPAGSDGDRPDSRPPHLAP